MQNAVIKNDLLPHSWSLPGVKVDSLKVDSGLGLSYRPARLVRLHRLASRHDNPICIMQESTITPRRGYEFCYCKGTLRQVFIRVYRLEIANFLRTFALWCAFSPVSPLPFSLVQLSPSPPFPVWISILYIRKQWVRWDGMGFSWRPYSVGVKHSVSDQLQNPQNCQITPNKNQPRRGGGLRQINTWRKVPLQVNFIFYRWRHFALPSISLIFLL